MAHKNGYWLGFYDESGISEKPTVRRTWAPIGQTPIIKSTGSWRTRSLLSAILCLPNGSRPELLLKSKSGSVKSEDIIIYLKELKKHVGRRKLLLFWDGLPAHRSKLVKEYLKYQTAWLRIERLPAYAPELNPVEYCWASFKNRDLCNLAPEGHFGLKQAIRKGCRRIKNDQQLLKGFIKASGLIGYST